MVEQRHNKEIEVDLVDILYKIISIRKILYKAAGIGLLIGLIVAFSIPKQYTVRVTLSPEMGNSKGNSGLAGLASSFLGNGAIVGEGPDALNASLSSDIVSSTPFLLELFEINVPINDKGGKVTLKEYLDTQVSPWWVYILNIPNMIISGIKYLVVTEEEGNVDFMRFGVIELTEENRKLIEVLKKKIVATVDKKTMITNVSVTLQDPKVAAIVADSAVRKLQKSIIGYRTSKAKDDCAYLENLFKERQIEYFNILLSAKTF